MIKTDKFENHRNSRLLHQHYCSWRILMESSMMDGLSMSDQMFLQTTLSNLKFEGIKKQN